MFAVVLHHADSNNLIAGCLGIPESIDMLLNPMEDRGRVIGREYIWIDRLGDRGARLGNPAPVGTHDTFALHTQ